MEKLLGWTLEEFAVAAEEYRAQTGKSPLSTLEGAFEVQSYWIATHGTSEVKLPEQHPYHAVPADLGWARALFGKLEAALVFHPYPVDAKLVEGLALMDELHTTGTA